jgi:hypothetical protein
LETELTGERRIVSEQYLQLAINIVIIALFGILAHWRIRDFMLASAIGAIAAAVYFQIIGIVTEESFRSFSVIGLVMSSVQGMIVTSLVGFPFEMRRRREKD